MNVVYLEILSFRGYCPGATHYYGNLFCSYREEGVKRKLFYRLSRKQAATFNKYNRSVYGKYKKGDLSERFFDEKDLIKEARKTLKKEFKDADLLIFGSSSVIDPQEILVGPRNLKTKANQIWRKTEKISWEENEKEMRKLSREWENLLGLKY